MKLTKSLPLSFKEEVVWELLYEFTKSSLMQIYVTFSLEKPNISIIYDGLSWWLK